MDTGFGRKKQHLKNKEIDMSGENEAYFIYLDGLCKDTKPKEWMILAMVEMLKQAFSELRDRDVDAAFIAREWLSCFYQRNSHV